MNATERKELRRATTLVAMGDRSAALAILRSLSRPPPQSTPEPTAQLVLAFVTFRCERLSTDGVQAHTCVTRQRVTDLQRTQQLSRGQGTDYPTCDTRSCEQGRLMRELLGSSAPMTWQGSGPGGRFERERSRAGVAAQAEAREHQRRVGLLAPVPTVDAVHARDEED